MKNKFISLVFFILFATYWFWPERKVKKSSEYIASEKLLNAFEKTVKKKYGYACILWHLKKEDAFHRLTTITFKKRTRTPIDQSKKDVLNILNDLLIFLRNTPKEVGELKPDINKICLFFKYTPVAKDGYLDEEGYADGNLCSIVIYRNNLYVKTYDTRIERFVTIEKTPLKEIDQGNTERLVAELVELHLH